MAGRRGGGGPVGTAGATTTLRIAAPGGTPTLAAAAHPLRQRSRPELTETLQYDPFSRTHRSRLTALSCLKMAAVAATGLPLLRLIALLLCAAGAALWLALVGCCLRCCSRRRRRRSHGDDAAEDEAMGPCTRRAFCPVRCCARGMLCAFGFWWVEERFPEGTPWCDRCGVCGCIGYRYLRRQQTPRVIVGTHHSYMDALYMGSRFLPTAVGKAAIIHLPLVGASIAAMHPILVPRTPEEKAQLPSGASGSCSASVATTGAATHAPGPRTASSQWWSS